MQPNNLTPRAPPALAGDRALSSRFLLLLGDLSYCPWNVFVHDMRMLGNPARPTLPLGKADSFLAIGWGVTGRSVVVGEMYTLDGRLPGKYRKRQRTHGLLPLMAGTK